MYNILTQNRFHLHFSFGPQNCYPSSKPLDSWRINFQLDSEIYRTLHCIFFFVKRVVDLRLYHSFNIFRDIYLFKINKETEERNGILNICKAYNIPIIRSTTTKKKKKGEQTKP